MHRRDVLQLSRLGLLGAATEGRERRSVPAPPPVSKRTSSAIRLACVPTAVEGGLMPELLAEHGGWAPAGRSNRYAVLETRGT